MVAERNILLDIEKIKFCYLGASAIENFVPFSEAGWLQFLAHRLLNLIALKHLHYHTLLENLLKSYLKLTLLNRSKEKFTKHY